MDGEGNPVSAGGSGLCRGSVRRPQRWPRWRAGLLLGGYLIYHGGSRPPGRRLILKRGGLRPGTLCVSVREKKKKKMWAEMSWMQIPRPPAGRRRGGAGWWASRCDWEQEAFSLAVLKVCCCRSALYCAQLLHCTALLTCKRECFKRRVHKQCCNGRNWHDHNTERYLHSQRQIPNFLTAAGASVSSSRSFFIPSFPSFLLVV